MKDRSQNRTPSRVGGIVMIVVASALILGGAASLVAGTVTGPAAGVALAAVIVGRVVIFTALAWLLLAGVRRVRRAGRAQEIAGPAGG